MLTSVWYLIFFHWIVVVGLQSWENLKTITRSSTSMSFRWSRTICALLTSQLNKIVIQGVVHTTNGILSWNICNVNNTFCFPTTQCDLSQISMTSHELPREILSMDVHDTCNIEMTSWCAHIRCAQMWITEMSIFILLSKNITTYSPILGRNSCQTKFVKHKVELKYYYQTTERLIAIRPLQHSASLLSSKTSENTPLGVSFMLHFTKKIKSKLFVL